MGYGVSKMFCFKEINTFIQQGCNKLIKSEIYNDIKNDVYLKTYALFELSIHQEILKTNCIMILIRNINQNNCFQQIFNNAENAIYS